MSKVYLEKMLKDLSFYSEVEITHTFSKNKRPLVTVDCYKNTYKLTFIANKNTEIYDNIEDAATAIHNVLNGTLEESTN
ncbi:hypothetical protein [Peribacillus glennii]|uniref:DUF1797 family protein n=1 Tax=Peribacillus glennii TaxID=2303991 RepID=A0A372LJR0_9BACI|nr:hypothetical protein [Peribacillus glennii]RFU66710.1 hypothetical protein D0466_00945 [Peribacillus glennii]